MTGTSPHSRTAKSASRAERLEARVSPEQKALFKRAAELQGRKLTDFMVSSLQEAALRVIEEAQLIRLSEQDSRDFAEALLRPRKPPARLPAAARRYLEAVR